MEKIGGEELQGGYNVFGEVFQGELLPGTARWDIFCHEADWYESRDPCMDKNKPKPIKFL